MRQDTSFKSTPEGGCSQTHRNPKVVGSDADATPRVTKLPGKDHYRVTWGHFRVENRDCISFFRVRHETGSGYSLKFDNEDVAGDADHLDLELPSDNWRDKTYTVQVVPSYHGYVPSDTWKSVPAASVTVRGSRAKRG